ncbi:MAG: nucleotidyltransferase family protein [Methylococcaceae bacterium]
MKAMILAAGRGERMRPLTDKIPKPLIEVGGQKLIEYHIHALAKAGVTELVINHAWLGDQIVSHLGDGNQYGVNIAYSAELEGALETAGGIAHALPLLGDEPFIVVNGDVWTDFDYSTLTPPVKQAHLIMVSNPNHHPVGDFSLKAGFAQRIGDDKLTFSGIAVYRPELFKKLPQPRYPLGPLLRDAMDVYEVTGAYFAGEWFDIGTVQRLTELDRQLRGYT